MIKALMLLFKPFDNWDRIARAQRGVAWILVFYLLPLLALSIGGELLGLNYLGRHPEMGRIIRVTPKLLAAYGAARFICDMLVVFIGAKLVKMVAETFHTRHNYTQGFTVAAYGLGPYFLLQLLNAFPAINPWVSFGIGIALTWSVLYLGVPRVFQPDPPHAFGLYLMSAILLASICGLARLLTLLVLHGKIRIPGW